MPAGYVPVYVAARKGAPAVPSTLFLRTFLWLFIVLGIGYFLFL